MVVVGTEEMVFYYARTLVLCMLQKHLQVASNQAKDDLLDKENHVSLWLSLVKLRVRILVPSGGIIFLRLFGCNLLLTT